VPFKIQRVPTGLSQVLTIFGGQTPQELEDRVRATIDVLQAYGLTQRQQLVAANAAVAEGANLSIVLPASWCILFAASISIAAAVGLVGAGFGMAVSRGGGAQQPVSFDKVDLAVAGGAIVNAFVPSYPLLLPPNSVISGVPYWLNGAATADAQVQCDVGVLG